MAFQHIRSLVCDGPTCTHYTRGYPYVPTGNEPPLFPGEENPEYQVDTFSKDSEAQVNLEEFAKEFGWYNVYADHGGYFTSLWFHELKCLKAWARKVKD